MMFRLQRHWPMPDGKVVDLWEEIVSGRKTVEYREATEYWWNRLFGVEYNDKWSVIIRSLAKQKQKDQYIYPKDLKTLVKTATFTIGYPKNNLPRIEADVSFVVYYYETDQLGTGFKNIKVINNAADAVRFSPLFANSVLKRN